MTLTPAPVSVLILTYNEEDNLPRCLDSVAWADDVLVVDSFSTDRTVEVARAHGARVLQRGFDTFAGQRNFGIDQGELRHDWVLHLDADEVVPSALRDELLDVARTGVKPAYRVASRMMFQGKWLRHAGMYPAYQVRYGRRDRLRFKQVGHGQREDLEPEDVGTLQHDLEHYSFSKGLHEWFAKHNCYSSDEAAEALGQSGDAIDWAALAAPDRTRRRRALKTLAARMPMRPSLRFFYMYVLRRGFLDGRAGLSYCRLLSTYEAMTVAKERELRLRQRGVSI
ncbi:glycosyltransferase family 2 protein [Rubrivirga sp.]|uniref:glycosyltransferase family 2 protein n=1 Tax=Rubrivirga sp. TaxID=1885344 RepID=UPI003C716D31